MRTLPLVGSFAEYFKEVKAAQEVNKKVCGNCYNYEYDGYVFVDELGNLMRPDYLTSYFPQYIQKHGCKKNAFSRFKTQLRKPASCERRTAETNSGVAGTQRFFHHR